MLSSPLLNMVALSVQGLPLPMVRQVKILYLLMLPTRLRLLFKTKHIISRTSYEEQQFFEVFKRFFVKSYKNVYLARSNGAGGSFRTFEDVCFRVRGYWCWRCGSLPLLKSMIIKLFHISTELHQKLMEIQVTIRVDWQNVPQILKLNELKHNSN